MNIRQIVTKSVQDWYMRNSTVSMCDFQKEALINTLISEISEELEGHGIPKDLPQSETVVPNNPEDYVRRCF